jgi:hypothetical protein
VTKYKKHWGMAMNAMHGNLCNVGDFMTGKQTRVKNKGKEKQTNSIMSDLPSVAFVIRMFHQSRSKPRSDYEE